MTTVRELVAKLGFKVDDASIKRWDKQVSSAKKAMIGASKGAKQLGKDLAQVAKVGAAAATAIGAFAIKTAASFESLQASLKTVTGSAEGADKAFKLIKDFAKSTPFSVQEITKAFVKLKSLGLEPSAAALKSYGNTASAMGKPLNDFIEAVADATTGEFERLKEFGIKAAVEGDKVALTFQGQTKVIGNNAVAIQQYLQAIGDVQFAGAMAAQMETFNGIISNLKDNIDQFLVSVADNGLMEAVRTVATDIRDMAGGGEDLAKVIGGFLGRAVTGLWDAFKRLMPAMEGILKGTLRIVDVFGGTLLDVFEWFVEAVGDAETAILILIPALVGLRVATVAAAGPWGVLAATILAAIPALMKVGDHLGDVMSDLTGLSEFIDYLDERNGGKSHNKRGTRGNIDASLEKITVQTTRDRLREESDETLMAWAVDDGIHADAKPLIYQEMQQRRLDAREQEKADDLAKSNAAREAGRASKKKGGGRRRKKDGYFDQEGYNRALDAYKSMGLSVDKKKLREQYTHKKKGEKSLSATELLERDFGAGLGHAGKATGVRPSLGTTINKITNTYEPKVQVEIKAHQRPGESTSDFAERVSTIVSKQIGDVFSRGYLHFKGGTSA